MPINKDIKKVMVIGSGPIIIGQAAEFDYAGTQACRSLREEGIDVILVNSNPATIMTDTNMADKVYLEPLTPGSVKKIIKKEKPDGLLPTLGGQVGLNIALELAEEGFLEKENVTLLGTPLSAIKKAEDREIFRATMRKIKEPVPPSTIVSTVEDTKEFARETGYPLIVRPAYTLGGTGGGFVYNEEELETVAARGIRSSIISQILVEKSVAGWKEIEFEVMRDKNDTCITICSMENIDPVGIHTGDSIVVAPALTLTDKEYQMLRSASLKIIRALGIEGGCNIQFALNPYSFEYIVIEVNPRLSRSSALASKATGYPIAKVASKIAVGLTLDEIKNAVTGQTYACFEPSIDYVVVKFPRWPFDKFASAQRTLGTQMKATGEVMAIDRNLEGALMKAVRSLEIDLNSMKLEGVEEFSSEQLEKKMAYPDDERIYFVVEALRRGTTIERIYEITKIDHYFLDKLLNIVNMEKEITKAAQKDEFLQESNLDILKQAKEWGFPDEFIAELAGITEQDVRKFRKQHNLKPTYKMVDTCAGEFPAETPYFYSTYSLENEAIPTPKRKIIVLGSGPIRIGQGVEFDYCSVHSVWGLKEEGIESIIINNNPETVSTDFDTSDRLYFEPLTPEDVLNIIELENPEGVIVQFGGQTAINLAEPLVEAGIKIIGTSLDSIDRAEDRDRFDQMLEELNIPRPPGGMATSTEEALKIATRVSYPVVVRPSYVLGGRAMEIVYNKNDMMAYMTSAVKASPKHPVLVDKYLCGEELEVDAVADGDEVLIPGIMRHIERAGIHSGDSFAVYPAGLPDSVRDTIVEYTTKLAQELKVKGIINIQYVLDKDKVYVIEVNPRSSRTVPFMSKITGIPMISLATKASLGRKLKDLGYHGGLYPDTPYVAVKAPVFSFSKLLDLDTTLGPEMKSTGEVLGIDYNMPKALIKALRASGFYVKPEGNVLATIANKDKEEALPLFKDLAKLDFNIYATAGTAKFLRDNGLQVDEVKKIREGHPNIVDLIKENKLDLVLNTLTKGKTPVRDGFRIRRSAVEANIPCLTSLDTAKAVVEVMKNFKEGEKLSTDALQEYLERLPVATP